MTWTEATDLDQIYQELRVDPHWLLYDFNLIKDRCQFLRVNETVYESSMFMDQRLNAESPQSVISELSLLLQKCANDRREIRPANYLFHIGHCGSTLISRLLGSQPGVLALREPLPVNSLTDVNRRLETDHSPIDADTYLLLEQFIARLLSRTFYDAQHVLVKPGSICCRIAHRLMSYHQDSKAILLYIDLESYLATMLRYDGNITETVRSSYAVLTDYKKLGGSAVFDPETLPVEKKIALNWLVQMAWLTRLYSSRPDTTRMLDFGDFLSAPVDTLKIICALTGIDSTPDALRTTIEGPLMGSYSKMPQYNYDENTRRSVLEKSRQAHEAEITTTLAWAADVCTSLPGTKSLASYLTSG